MTLSSKLFSVFALLTAILCAPLVATSLGFQDQDEQEESGQVQDGEDAVTGETDSEDGASEEEEEEEFAPVDDMHHFMMHITKPPYRELRELLNAEEIRRSTWRKVQQHALILAETTILVAERTPEDPDDAAKWRAASLGTYNAAAALYRAAGDKDQETALEQWGLMIDSCNACHVDFDENNHQMEK